MGKIRSVTYFKCMIGVRLMCYNKPNLEPMAQVIGFVTASGENELMGLPADLRRRLEAMRMPFQRLK
jgi:hypothetical protein